MSLVGVARIGQLGRALARGCVSQNLTHSRAAWSSVSPSSQSFNSKFHHIRFASNEKSHQRIRDLITKSNKPVFVFMKGVPSQPQCRYSGVVVQIMDAYGVEYDSFDVLEDDQVRQDIKSYSNWPTIPQVFKDGEFIGGCDILLQMHQSGEFSKVFGCELGGDSGGSGANGGQKKGS